MPTTDVTINPLYKELSAALGHPHFMRGGGVLGFPCHHKYVYTDLNTTSSLPGLLKGADQIVYTVAKSLSLSVIVKPVLDGSYYPYHSHQILLKRFPKFIVSHQFDEELNPNDEFTSVFRDGHHVKHITWCQTFDDSQQQAAGCTGTYGNEPGIRVFYQTAAILVGIPEWGEYRKSCGSAKETSGNESLESESGEMPAKRHCRSKAIIKKLCFHGEMPPVDEW